MLEVVIVSFRCREMLRDCLTSLRSAAPREGLNVKVVDNASGDGTLEMLDSQFPDVHAVPLARNVGFAAANNAALREATATYVLVLNPDTRVPPVTLDALLELMESNPQIGIAGCRLELEDGTFDHAARRSFPTVSSSIGHFLRFGRYDRAPLRFSAYRAPNVERGPVDAVNGAFMLIRRAMLDDIGLFDEGYWMYMEDLDICYRAAQAGWITWFEPSVHAVHVKAGTSGAHRNLRLTYAFHYGMFRYYRKHLAASGSRVVNGSVYAGIGAKFLLSASRSGVMRALAATLEPRRTAKSD
jgi:N-acetylglucosaminyl-diphospho-decaprenol L-rhamnosyltransferase